MKRTLFSISLIIALALGIWLALPTQKALAATCTWNGSVSDAWGNASNWTGCAGVPASTDSVTIPTSAHNPRITSSVTIVTIQIDSGATLTVDTGGSLVLNGNLVCNGSFSVNSGIATTFSGTDNQTVSGSGSTTFGTIIINNSGGTNHNIVEIMPNAFSGDEPLLTTGLLHGILKFSGSYTFSNSLFTDNNYIINSTAGIWLNNSNVTINAAQGHSDYSSLYGLLHITAGTYHVGDEVGESFRYDTPASVIIDGGSLIVAGGFNGISSSSDINFTMSSGTLTLAAISGYSGVSTFSILGNSSNVAISGGTIVLVNKDTTDYDFYNSPGGTTIITGGTVQFGSSSTTGSPAFSFLFSKLPSLSIVRSGSNTTSASAYGDSTVYGNVTINPGTTLNANGHTITISSNSVVAPGNWTNNDTFTAALGSVIFNGTYGQTIGGANPTTFYNLTDDNTSSSGVMLADNVTVSNDLVVDANHLLNVSTYSLTVGNTLTNHGLLRATQDVNGTSDVLFFHTGSYGGVILNASGSNLGTTTVTIWGDHDCTNTLGETVARCFYINPTNTTLRDARITFFFNLGEIPIPNTCETLNAYHYSTSQGWSAALQLDTTYPTNPDDGRDCGGTPPSLRVVHVDTFSPFALKSVAPTVIELRNLTAQSNARISLVLLAGALGLLVMGGGLLYLRGRKVQ